jgi:RNA exonuclease 1
MATLFSVPQTRKRKRAADAERRGGPSGLPPPHAYALDRAAMAEREYPLPYLDAAGEPTTPPGWASTRRAGSDDGRPSSPPHALVAVDCEMCVTAAGYELARVSAVGADGSVLLDELVAPANPVLDYNTRFSGIDEATLAGVTTTLAEARAALLTLLHADTVLIGHALENDLRALRLLHARVVDTGVLFPHPRGPPFRTALRRLSERFLKRVIQTGTGGHDSVDDARAAMDLALLKFRKGPDYGVPDGAPAHTDKLARVLTAASRKAVIVDRPDAVNRHMGGAADGVPVGTDSEAAAKAARAVAAPAGGQGAPHLVWTRLTSLAALQEARADAARAAVSAHAERVERGGEEGAALPPLGDGCPPPPGSAPTPPAPSLLNPDEYGRQVDATLASLDAHVGTLIDAAPPNTLVVVATCHGDTADTRRLQEQAYRRARGLDGLPPWSVAAEAHLAGVREAGMRALVFCRVKQ